MLFYCLKCRKNTENKNLKDLKNERGRIMLSSKFIRCQRKKIKFFWKQKASILLSNLGLKTPLSKVPILGDILF